MRSSKNSVFISLVAPPFPNVLSLSTKSGVVQQHHVCVPISGNEGQDFPPEEVVKNLYTMVVLKLHRWGYSHVAICSFKRGWAISSHILCKNCEYNNFKEEKEKGYKDKIMVSAQIPSASTLWYFRSTDPAALWCLLCVLRILQTQHVKTKQKLD